MQKKLRKFVVPCAIAMAIAGGTIAAAYISHNDETKTRAQLLDGAQDGDVDAQLTLGLQSLTNGKQDDALHWISAAAKSGHPEAQTMLAKIYTEGKLVERDAAKAVTWLHAAAEQNFGPGLIALAAMFRDGIGVEQNLTLAEMYFNKAATLGDKTARLELASLYGRDDFPKASAKSMSKKLYIQLAQEGEPLAMLGLARLYARNDQLRESCDWFQKAAAKGSSAGAIGLAQCFQHGQGRSANKVEFLRWMMTAAEADNPNAQFALGDAYLFGHGTSRDPQEAASWFHKAADLGHTEAQYNLGVMYAKGLGVDADPKLAMSLLAEAAKAGSSHATDILKQFENQEFLTKLQPRSLSEADTAQASHH